jgi:hypothetical protein
MPGDRDLTKRMLAAATGWREAARAIQPLTVEGMFLWPPFYTTLFYALEQSLKAFLASQGASRSDLREIGHSLNELARRSEEAGLELGKGRFPEFLAQLEGKLLELRYLEGEAIELADPEEAMKLVDEHFQVISRAIPIGELLGLGEAPEI